MRPGLLFARVVVAAALVAAWLPTPAYSQVSLGVTPTSLSPGVFQTPYAPVQFVGSGGQGPYTFAFLDPAALPPGMQLTTGGLFSGTPGSAGVYFPTLVVKDANNQLMQQPLTFTVAVVIAPPVLSNGMVGLPYNQVLTGLGGRAPYSFSISSGTLPAGVFLGIDQVTGATQLTGTPTATGTSNFTVQVWDSNDGMGRGSRNYDLTIDPALAVTTSTLAIATMGSPYSQLIAATGGSPPYTVTVTDLPAGLAYNAAKTSIEGTPTEGGYFFPIITVTDSLNRQASAQPFLTVQVPFLISTPATLPAAIAGVQYNLSLATTPSQFLTVSWLLAPGSPALPNGVTLSSDGTLSGIPRQPGTYSFTVEATAYIPSGPVAGIPRQPRTHPFTVKALIPYALPLANQVAVKGFTLVVGPTNLTIVPASLGSQTAGDTVGIPFSATGATPPYTWAVIAGALPPGTTLGAKTGVLGGTVDVSGTFTFTIQVTDSSGQTATRQFSLLVKPRIDPLSITTGSLPDGMYGQSYGAGLMASGGTEPYSWSASGLPPGLSLNGGSISGTPTDAGTFAVSVTVTDSGGRKDSKTFSLLIKAPPLVITTSSPSGTFSVGSSFSMTFAATGGVPPYIWIPRGAPPGTSSSGAGISGTLTQAGTFRFSAQVKDSKGTLATKDFDITVTGQPLTVSSGALPDGHVGTGYAAGVSATGGQSPYKWVLSGLPGGLSGDASGNISGTPTAAGKFTVQATVTDSSNATASGSYSLAILGAALTITGGALPHGTAGVPYTATISAQGGTPPYQWSIVAGFAGALGIAGGVLSGTPSDAGDYSFVVQVTDASGAKATATFNWTVDLALLTITTGSLPNGTVGVAYSAGVSASGNSGTVKWSASGLPAGLSMDAGGGISGTPTAPGTSSVSVSASDGAGRTTGKTLSLTVGLPPTPNPTFRGIPDTTNPGTQLAVGLGLDGSYPVPISGTVTLTFAADSGGDDPTVRFSNGARTVDLTIPAGADLATFTIPNLALQSGTVAGTITLTATLSAMGQNITPTPVRTIRINPAAPGISRVTAVRTVTGIDVTITGFANTRSVTQAIFHFNPAAGSTLQSSDVTVQVDGLFNQWFQSAASQPYGGQFTFTQSFTVSDPAAIASITVTLVSGAGRSDPVTANVN